MTTAELLSVLRRRLALVVVGLVTGVLVAGALTLTATPQYEATATLLVSGASSGSGDAADEVQRRVLATQRAATYAQVATTDPAVAGAVEAAGLEPGVLVAVEASADSGSPFLSVSVTSSEASRAQAVANAYAQSLPQTLVALEQGPDALPPEDAVSLLEPAALPRTAFSPRPIRNLLVGLVLGGAVGVAAAFARENLDRRLRTVTEVEEVSGLPVLAAVPLQLGKETLPVRSSPTSARAEAYRTLRANLQFTGPEGAPRSVLVTSAVEGEGKTTVAANLAIAAARAGDRVVLVDADLRRPRVAQALDLVTSPGISNVLAGGPLREALRRDVEPGLSVLPSGSRPEGPAELLAGRRFSDLVRKLEQHFDLVVIDGPPILPVADAVLVAPVVSACVVVNRLGVGNRDRLVRALAGVAKVGGRTVGVVANAVRGTDDETYAYTYTYYGPRTRAEKAAAAAERQRDDDARAEREARAAQVAEQAQATRDAERARAGLEPDAPETDAAAAGQDGTGQDAVGQDGLRQDGATGSVAVTEADGSGAALQDTGGSAPRG